MKLSGAGLIALTCFGFGAAIAWGLLGPWRWADSKSLAEWIGALGTIAAVGVAIAAPILHAERMRSVERAEAIAKVAGLAWLAFDAIDTLAQRFDENDL